MRSRSSGSARISSRIAASPRASSGSARGEALGGVRRRRCRSPCPTAARRSASAASGRRRARTPQRMPPELFAITPPTVAKSVDAGSGPRRRPCRHERAVDVAEHRARLRRARARRRPATAKPRKWRRTSTRMPSPWRLAVQARAARAQRHRDARAPAVGEHLRDVVGVVRHHDGPAGSAGRGWRPTRTRTRSSTRVQHAVGAEQRLELGAQRLGRAAGELVGHAVGRRLGDGRRERRRGHLEQRHARARRRPRPARGALEASARVERLAQLVARRARGATSTP